MMKPFFFTCFLFLETSGENIQKTGCVRSFNINSELLCKFGRWDPFISIFSNKEIDCCHNR
jgi:hypothetical protein